MSITMKWLIAACILFVIGLILCFVSFIIPGNDFNRITVRKYETNTYDVDEAFDNIKIVADKAEITVVPSDDDRCSVICYEDENVHHRVGVEDNILKIGIPDGNNITWNPIVMKEKQTIKVCLPKKEYKDFVVSADNEEISITDVNVKDLKIESNVGDIILTNVIASGSLNIDGDIGDISFDKCDAETIYVKTDIGDVTGTLLTDKNFVTKTDTGSIDVPEDVSGGSCVITTDTGDIRIEICK